MAYAPSAPPTRPSTRSWRHLWWRLVLMVALGLMLIACGATATMLGKVTVIRRGTTQTFQASPTGALFQLTAQCQPGEQLISGGYDLIYNLADPLQVQPWVLASYPSDPSGAVSQTPTAWTVRILPPAAAWTGQTPSPSDGGGLSTFVECLTAPFALSVQAATATTTLPGGDADTGGGPFSLQAPCPAGTLLTGGGFSTDWQPSEDYMFPVLTDFYPGSTGGGAVTTLVRPAWTISGAVEPISPKETTPPLTVSTYAMCLAATPLKAVPAVTQPLTIPQDTAPTTCSGVITNVCFATNQVTGTVACPAHALLVGGGFSDLVPDFGPTGINLSLQEVSLVTEAATADGASWLTQVRTAQQVAPGALGAGAKLNTWAVCLST